MKARLAALTLREAARLVAEREVEPRDIFDACMENVKRFNDRLRAFITIFNYEQPRARRGKPLYGMPISLKDLIYTAGKPTTAGSKILSSFTPSYDATIVERLMAGGAVITGKTNLHEFAFGVTNKNPHYGVCRNPWNEDRISGGSSGGSAVSVAAGMSLASIGTDTAGSVRIPASLCGVVGYKPSYGLISRHGIIPLSWSLDHVGFLTRSVGDAAFLAALTAGRDKRDESTIPAKLVGIEAAIRPAQLRRLKIGIPRNYFLDILEQDVRRVYEDTIARAEAEGATLREVEVEKIESINAVRYIIVHAEAAAYHRRFIQERFNEYGEDLKRRLAQGLAIPASTYLNAQRARRRLSERFRRVFKDVDILITPTTPITAPRVEDNTVELDGRVMDVRPALLRLTEPINVVGAPAISIPAGKSRDGLPIGVQLVADVLQDRKLMAAALALEKILPPTATASR
ncbi:MAG: amidase [Aigarchaeota archaeon]|nr:amidase [Candidatus Pelearchaeum maunauluense]